MKFYSTNNKSNLASFKQAVIKGLADDGGLYMPFNIPAFDKSFFNDLKNLSFQEIGFKIASSFIDREEIEYSKLESIVNDAINFPAPVIKLTDSLSILELFHGPTLAFKDFGARFLARAMSCFNENSNHTLNILVATSGDTGSAVANGFYGVEGINVFLLYPKNKVSPLQEKQLTTLDKNIIALEIDGTFDDCQRLVKQAFVDKEINEQIRLSSANSINIGRLIPQVFYYFEAIKQLGELKKDVVVSVPSGNLGNLTAGLIAREMGLPVSKFIAAVNANTVFQEYIKTGIFTPKPSVKTYSNAMDVGNPSNLVRINELFDNNISLLRQAVFSFCFTDEQTVSTIKEMKENYNYIIDPHGAVGYLAFKKYCDDILEDVTGVVIETAHPAKFSSIVEEAIGEKTVLPKVLSDCLLKEKHTIELSSDYSRFKEFLLSSNSNL